MNNTRHDTSLPPQTNVPLQEDEHLDPDDGLIYCSKCHMPRQIRRIQLGRVFMPRVLCRCQAEQRDKEEQERLKRDHMAHVSRLRASGLQSPHLRNLTFDKAQSLNPEMERTLEKAHAYVDQWEEMKKRSLGLLLWGPVGNGKTFFAGCIANALIEKEVPVLMTNFLDLLDILAGMYPGERIDYIRSLDHFDLLIIDDLGAERDSDFTREQIYHVIDSRCRSNKPMIVSTNHTLDELKNPAILDYERIYDRILERCAPILFDSINIRSLHAAENLAAARRLLSSGGTISL